MEMYKVVFYLVVGVVFLLCSAFSVEATPQDSYTIAWDDLETGYYKVASDDGPVFLGDGAEYSFSVDGAPGNAKFKWYLSPSGGVSSVEHGEETSSSSMTWQAPMSGSSYEIKVEAWVPGGDGEDGDTLKGKWVDQLKVPIVDTYWEKVGGNRSTSEVYVAAPEDPEGTEYPTKVAYVFVGYAEGEQENALEGIATDWTVDEEKEGITDANKGKFQDGAQWVTEIRKRTVASGEASVTFRTSRKAGDWHKAKATVYDKPEDENDTKQLVKGDPSPKITVLGVDLDIYNGGSDLDNGESAGSQGAAVSEDDEESVGAYLLVNWDNDDGDSPPVPDLDESSVTNEDNLAKLVPSIDPSASTLQAGTVELEVTAGATKIKIWRSSTKGTELTLTDSKKTWDLSNSGARTDFNSACTDGLWIEGRNWSNERGIVLKLSYKNSGGQEISSDTVKATSVILRIGNGVYRENDIPGNSARGHAGLLLGYTGNCVAADFNDDTKYKAIHMTGSGPAYTDLDDFTNTSGKDYWGAYTKSGITYAQRLKVMKSAEDIETEDPEYKWIDCLEPDGDDWDGTVEDIYALRCDGVVEVAYEINDVDVWGMTNGSTHYDIRDYLSEHNNFDLIGWSDTLMPATQCGHVTPVDADTTFGTQPICLPTSLRD